MNDFTIYFAFIATPIALGWFLGVVGVWLIIITWKFIASLIVGG